jgi:hypothetical protein
MTGHRVPRTAVAALAVAALVPTAGCTPPKVMWSQRVVLNGTTFKFKRIDSLLEGPEGQRVEYRDGDFTIVGRGPITVNGFEVAAGDGAAVLANQRIELKPGDQVIFASDMSWTVEPGPAASAPPAAPAAPPNPTPPPAPAPAPAVEPAAPPAPAAPAAAAPGTPPAPPAPAAPAPAPEEKAAKPQ